MNVVNFDKAIKQKGWKANKSWINTLHDLNSYNGILELSGDEWTALEITLDFVLANIEYNKNDPLFESWIDYVEKIHQKVKKVKLYEV